MKPGKSGKSRRRRVQWLWAGYWASLFVATHVPQPPGVVLPFRWTDKLVHVVLYAGLALLGGHAQRVRYHRVSVAVMATWALIYTMYAAVDEWLQDFVGRQPEWSDFVADACGVVIGTALYLLIRRRRTVSTAVEASRNAGGVTTR